MALFSVCEVHAGIAEEILLTQSKSEAIKLVQEMQASGKDAFWEQVQ
jgi:hypothetical protein